MHTGKWSPIIDADTFAVIEALLKIQPGFAPVVAMVSRRSSPFELLRIDRAS